MTVSVVIPVHNGERYLAAALDSVLAQTVQPAEVIVVDDGSSDGSVAVAERYSRIAPVRCIAQAQAGPAAARNRGAAEARGEFLAFLDADDLWAQGKLARQLDALADDPRVDGVLGHVRQFVSPDLDPAAAARVRRPGGLAPGWVHGTLLVRRAAYERVSPMNEELMVGEFLDWLESARAAGLRMVMLDDELLARRLHDSNHTLRQRAARTDYARILKAALDRRRAAGETAA